MAGKPYKQGKRGAGRHVQLSEELMRTEAWSSLKCGPRALYVELKRRFNGLNNGRLVLSHREAALALGTHRNTVGPWFKELQAKGFITQTQAPHLGPSGVGLAGVWALQELPTAAGKRPTREFASYSEKQKPRTNSGQARHKKQDTQAEKDRTDLKPVLKIVTGR